MLVQVHKREDGRYLCHTCNAVICSLCVVDHTGHAVIEIAEVYAKQQADIENLQRIIDDKVRDQKRMKADLEKQREQIRTQCKKVRDIVLPVVVSVWLLTLWFVLLVVIDLSQACVCIRCACISVLVHSL